MAKAIMREVPGAKLRLVAGSFHRFREAHRRSQARRHRSEEMHSQTDLKLRCQRTHAQRLKRRSQEAGPSECSPLPQRAEIMGSEGCHHQRHRRLDFYMRQKHHRSAPPTRFLKCEK